MVRQRQRTCGGRNVIRSKRDMKTYVITLSKVFPSTHPRAGEPTNFRSKFERGIKIHTIRANYSLWAKRIAEVQNGEACLSIRQWTGKPYRSKQETIATLTKDDGVGIQVLKFSRDSFACGRAYTEFDNVITMTRNISIIPPVISIDLGILAHNDGLSLQDWKDWFKDYALSKPMAIIHFTKFRY